MFSFVSLNGSYYAICLNILTEARFRPHSFAFVPGVVLLPNDIMYKSGVCAWDELKMFNLFFLVCTTWIYGVYYWKKWKEVDCYLVHTLREYTVHLDKAATESCIGEKKDDYSEF